MPNSLPPFDELARLPAQQILVVRDGEFHARVHGFGAHTAEQLHHSLDVLRGQAWRNALVGTLIEAGKGNLPDLDKLPARSGPTAPAKGLFLASVEYAEEKRGPRANYFPT